MGEIADAMLSGLFCSMCGVILDGDEPGYSRTCMGCGGDTEEIELDDKWINDRAAPEDKRTPCPICGKYKKNLAAHMEAKHRPSAKGARG